MQIKIQWFCCFQVHIALTLRLCPFIHVYCYNANSTKETCYHDNWVRRVYLNPNNWWKNNTILIMQDVVNTHTNRQIWMFVKTQKSELLLKAASQFLTYSITKLYLWLNTSKWGRCCQRAKLWFCSQCILQESRIIVTQKSFWYHFPFHRYKKKLIC